MFDFYCGHDCGTVSTAPLYKTVNCQYIRQKLKRSVKLPGFTKFTTEHCLKSWNNHVMFLKGNMNGLFWWILYIINYDGFSWVSFKTFSVVLLFQYLAFRHEDRCFWSLLPGGNRWAKVGVSVGTSLVVRAGAAGSVVWFLPFSVVLKLLLVERSRGTRW